MKIEKTITATAMNDESFTFGAAEFKIMEEIMSLEGAAKLDKIRVLNLFLRFTAESAEDIPSLRFAHELGSELLPEAQEPTTFGALLKDALYKNEIDDMEVH